MHSPSLQASVFEDEDEALVYWIFLGRVDVFVVSTMGYEEERLPLISLTA